MDLLLDKARLLIMAPCALGYSDFLLFSGVLQTCWLIKRTIVSWALKGIWSIFNSGFPKNREINATVWSSALAFKRNRCPLFASFLQLVQEEGGRSLLQSLGHSLHSRERLIQVGEVMRGGRTQSCTQQLDLLGLWLKAGWNVVCLWSHRAALKWQHQHCTHFCLFTTLYQWHCSVFSLALIVAALIFSCWLCWWFTAGMLLDCCTHHKLLWVNVITIWPKTFYLKPKVLEWITAY